jgi:uncharacterized repeat protein (TIGR01451 family)
LGTDCTPDGTSGDSASFSVTHPDAQYPASDDSALHPGSHVIKVTYHPAKGSPYAGRSQKSYTHVVDKAAVGGSVSASPNPSDHGQTVTYSATVRPSTADGLPPTGTVAFSSGGQLLCTASLDPTGAANNAAGSCESKAAPAGSHTVVARYSGDDNYLARSASFGQTVRPVADVGVQVTGSPSTVTSNSPVTYTVRVTNAGPDTAKDVVLSDVFPKTQAYRGKAIAAYYVGHTGAACSNLPAPYSRAAGQTVRCDLGDIPAGQSATVSFSFTLVKLYGGSAQHTYSFTDTARVTTGTGQGANPGADTDSATVRYQDR